KIGEQEATESDEGDDEATESDGENRVKSLEVNFSNIPDEQRNLYKALVEAYDADKTILDTCGESAILKRRHEEDDDQEGPSAGSDWGSKRRREGGEHASASTLSEPATGSVGRSTTGTQSRQLSASESTFAEEPVQTTCQMEEPSHLVFETELGYHLEEVYKAMTDQLDWDNPKGQQYPHNLL
nr:hypothetical protein [Tanacetum cinerariifolium]